MSEPESPDGITARERQALALWRAPEPPADLADRVVARLAAERASGGAARPFALAALAVAVVMGLFAARLLSSAAGAPPGAGEVRLVGGVGDGGGAAETSARGDVAGERVRS
jgi:hypothetical protein